MKALLRTSPLIAALVATVCAAQEKPAPTLRILPQDVVRDSVRAAEWRPDRFLALWKYTDAGAKKALAFREAHEGKEVRVFVKDLGLSQLPEIVRKDLPISEDAYARWKARWLKSRMDTVFEISEAESRRIVTELTGEKSPTVLRTTASAEKEESVTDHAAASPPKKTQAEEPVFPAGSIKFWGLDFEQVLELYTSISSKEVDTSQLKPMPPALMTLENDRALTREEATQLFEKAFLKQVGIVAQHSDEDRVVLVYRSSLKKEGSRKSTEQ